MRLIRWFLTILFVRDSDSEQSAGGEPVVTVEAPCGGFFSILLGPIEPQPDLRIQYIYLEPPEPVDEGQLIATVREDGRRGPEIKILSPVRGILRKWVTPGNTFVNRGQPLFEIEEL